MDTFTGSKQGTMMLHFPAQHIQYVCKSVCLTICLSVRLYSLYLAKRLVPFLLFTFSQSQPPPLCIPLFVRALLIDCLFISAPAAASAVVDEIVMVIVIFCGMKRRVKATG